MQWAKTILPLVATLVATTAATPCQRLGQAFQIVIDREMEAHGNRNESGRSSSTDRESYVERITGMSPNGVVLEYDLPANASSEARISNWQFPFRVIKAADGTLSLLNVRELEGRIDRWLKVAGLQRAACGRQFFVAWNSFRIECDPQSTIRWLATLTLPNSPEAGSSFTDIDSKSPATLRQASSNRLIARLAVDPSTILHQRAEIDVRVAALMHKPLTLQAALKAHDGETVTGTVTVTFEMDTSGQVLRRARVRMVQVAWANGRIDTETITETLSRNPI